MEMQIEEEWSRAFDTIKSKHDLAYRTIETAIRNEEQEQPELAMKNYKLGISLIDERLNVQVAVPDELNHLDESWSDACKMIHKMKRTRGEVLQRLTTLGQKYELVDESYAVSSPTASNGHKSTTTMRPRTYFELSEELRSIRINDKKSIDAMELLFSCEGVKLFYISGTGGVTTSSEDSVLRIVEVAENLEKKLERTYFLQILEQPHAADPTELQDISSEAVENDISWVYPLYPGTSPCYRTDFGAYVFPDLQADQPGCAIGIVVPSGSDEIVMEILESLLHGIVKQGVSDDNEELRRTRRATADVVSQNLVKGAYCISNGLVKGSEKIGQFVTYSTPFIISKMACAPNNVAPVSERVINGVEIAKSATTVAASFTGYVAGKVGSATMALGKFLAPHIQRQGSKLLTSAAGYSQEEANETMAGVLNVTSGAVEGFSTVYAGLEKSAGILGTNLSNNSVKIIEHKYGPSAGEVAAGAFDTVGNIIHVSQNVNYMTPKGLVKKAAKHTGKAIVSEFRPPLLDVKYVPAGSLFPDLSEFAKAAATKQ